MKPLPKEFQFKCDEHSREQCELLGIQNLELIRLYEYCLVVKNQIRAVSKTEWLNSEDVGFEFISLADYIEPELPEWLDSPPVKPNNHSDLIVELTGKYVAGLIGKREVNIGECIELAEETVKQLKERGYLK